MTDLDDAPAADLASEASASEAPAPNTPATASRPNYTIDLLSEVEIDVTVELGRRRLSIGEVTRLDAGSVIELDTLAGEPLVVYANGRQIATGEVVVVDGKFGVRIQALSGGA